MLAARCRCAMSLLGCCELVRAAEWAVVGAALSRECSPLIDRLLIGQSGAGSPQTLKTSSCDSNTEH